MTLLNVFVLRIIYCIQYHKVLRQKQKIQACKKKSSHNSFKVGLTKGNNTYNGLQKLATRQSYYRHIFVKVTFQGIVFLRIMISLKLLIYWYIICWVSEILIFGPVGAWPKYLWFDICRSYIYEHQLVQKAIFPNGSTSQ